MFVTLLFAVLDLRNGALKYARAGHLPPMILDGMGAALPVTVQNSQPLGLYPDIPIDQQVHEIPRGGAGLLFSDGLNEAADAQGNEFGFQGCWQICRLTAGKAPRRCAMNYGRRSRSTAGQCPTRMISRQWWSSGFEHDIPFQIPGSDSQRRMIQGA